MLWRLPVPGEIILEDEPMHRMNEISKLYKQYLSLTDNPQAAATLELAHVTCDKRQTPAPGAPLTVMQAAELLNVSPNTVYQLCTHGQLRHQRIGAGRGTIRIRREDLARVTVDREDDQAGLDAFERHCRQARAPSNSSRADKRKP
jgi:excisionase family DNA binding protein